MASLFSNVSFSAKITNFKSGLACTDGKTFGWICHETSRIYVTGQSKCIWNKEERPCTWYGFEFDYTGITEDTKILCSSTSSHPSNKGNPKEVLEENTTEDTYELPVRVGDGHFYNPQYSTLSVSEIDNNVVKQHTNCRIDGKKIFEFSFEFVFPTKSHNKGLQSDAKKRRA